MSRTTGTYTLTSNIEPKVGAPLDARTIVKLKSDLTTPGTFAYPYVGLTVFVEEDQKKYTLTDIHYTYIANWREEGSGTSTSADHVTYDNTASQLESTNVQDAIDEIVSNLGTAASKDATDQVTEDSEDLITSGAVYDALENLPSDDTWRSVQVNGTEVQNGTTSSGPLKLVNGTNTNVAFDSTNKTIQVNATDTNTTYTLSQDQSDGHKITLTPSSGSAQTVTIPDNNTTYTFESGTNSFKVTPSGSTAQTVNVTPSIADATTSASGLMSASDKTKLNGVATGAEVNQNAFSNVKVGNTIIQADSKTDTLELVAGSNVAITPNDTDDKVTISATDTNTTYSLTQDSSDGHKLTLTPSTGTAQTVTIPDNNTTYTLSTGAANGQIKVTPSIGSAYNVDVKGLGSAAYKNSTTSVTQNSADLVTSGAVWSAIDNLPEPMIMKGTLGTGGTITSLPTASASNEGFVYKVITAGTYAGQAAKIGDFFVSCKPEGASAYSWIWFPSGDETFTDTWRSIKVNGTEKLGNAISSGAVDFVNGTNTTVEFVDDGKKIKINSSDTNTHRPIQVNGTQNLGDNTTPLNLKNGTNITVTADGGNVTIATSAEVNQNAFSNVKVGSTTVAADSKTDTLELVAGSNVTLTPDATNDKITIAATDTNTHRPIQMNGTEILGNNTTALNLKAGSNVSLTNSSGTVTIAATNTTYTAGTGLTLDSGAFRTDVPRLNGSSDDSKTIPGVNRFNIREFGNSTLNFPYKEWYHLLTIEGSDNHYATQLALNMTNKAGVYYRKYDNSTWGDWYRLNGALIQKYQTISTTNKWYKLFTISYSQYNYAYLHLLIKAGFENMYEVFLCLRFTPNGIGAADSYAKIIPYNSSSKNVRLYQVNDTTFGLAVNAQGATSQIGFELLDMSSEADTLNAWSLTIANPFTELETGPTTFGNHRYFTGNYADINGTPSLNYLPLAGGTMTGGITFNKVNNAIVYTGTKATYNMVKFIDNTGDEYGNGISIGGGGLTIIGGGESADAVASGKSGGSEMLYLSNDQNVQIITGVQNGLSNAKTFDFKTDGTATFDGKWVGRFTANPTSGQVVITDGTTGGIKSSGYTIAKSVPSNADFSNTTYTFAGGTNGFTVTPSGGSAQTVSIKSNRLSNEDTRNTNQAPSWYMTNYARSIANEFKATASIGADSSSLLNTNWCNLLTLVPWGDNSGSRPVQIAIANDGTGKRVQRVATADDTWGSWILLPNQDTNTWRGIQNNLTSDSTTDSLSAAQGKALANGSARDSTKLPLTGGTMTGDIIFNKTGATDLTQVQMKCGVNDYGRVAAGGTASNSGWMEIATADDGAEPIYARQYSGVYSSIVRTATLLDASGNTSFPGILSLSKTVRKMLTGTGTAAQDKGSGVSPRYFPAKWAFNIGIATPADGDIVTIKIPVAGHDFGTFLSLDNGTTYKPISVDYGTGRLTTHYAVNRPITLIYDSSGQTNSVYAAAGADARSNVTGGCWRVMNFWDSGNTYDRNRYNCNIKAWGTKIIGGNIIVGINGLYHHLKEGTAFDITYPILYLNGDCNASATTSNTYDIIHFTVTTTQSISLTSYTPVYIKGTLSGNTFTPVSATPLIQTIPTSRDDYVYILLGMATSATTIYLQERHPIYAFRDGKFGEVTRSKFYDYSLFETKNVKVDYQNWCDTNTMIHANGNESVLFSRFFAQNDEANYATYHYPCVDSHIMTFTIDNNISYFGSIAQDIRTHDLYIGGKDGNTWRNWRKVWDNGNLSSQAAASGGTAVSLVTTGEKYTWNNKASQDTKNTAGSTDTSSKIFLIGAISQAANPQTYSDDQVYTTSGTLQTNITKATTIVNANSGGSGTAGGLALYSDANPEVYGVMFRTTANSGKHGYVQSDWATYLTMSNSDNRGWIFRRQGSANVASINTSGNAVFNGSVTVGGNSTNTSGARMEYNSTNHCIDFIVT